MRAMTIMAAVLIGGFPDVDPGLIQRAERGDGVDGFPVGPAIGGFVTSNPDSFDVRHVDLSLRLNPVTEQVTAAATLTIMSLQNGLAHAVIDLHDSLTVSRVLRDGVVVPFTRAGAAVDAVLDSTYAAGGEFDLTIEYAGHPAPIGNKGFRFDVHAGVKLAYTLSTPYSTSFATTYPISSRWRPCKENPRDKSTASFHFTVPDTFLASSNGLLTGVTMNGDGTATFDWQTTHLISPYLICFSTTNFDTIRDTYVSAAATTMPIIHHAFPEQLATTRTAYSRVPAMITALAARFGEYPFVDEKYGMTTVRGSTAVENQTNTSMPMSLIRADHANDWLYAHELSHQWWGDCVTVADWSHVWLSEGFATYGEALYTESRGGADSLRAWMETKSGPYPGTLVNPDYVWVNTVYQKGAWVLHMLRHILGDTAFFGALADYRAAHAFDVATTNDFKAALEGRYGSSLDWFFDPWAYGTGVPHYAVAWNSAAAGDSFRVRVELRQTHPLSEPTYAMPLDLRIDTAGGPVNVVVWNDTRDARYDFMVAAAPAGVTLDPGHWVLRVIDAFPTDVPAIAGPVAGTRASLDLAIAPNPAREATTLEVNLPRAGDAGIDIYDTRGRLARTWRLHGLGEGSHLVTWDRRDAGGRQVAPGLYFARIRFEAGSVERKILVLP